MSQIHQLCMLLTQKVLQIWLDRISVVMVVVVVVAVVVVVVVVIGGGTETLLFSLYTIITSSCPQYKLSIYCTYIKH